MKTAITLCQMLIIEDLAADEGNLKDHSSDKLVRSGEDYNNIMKGIQY